MIAYTVPAIYGDEGGVTYPQDDPLIAFTRAHCKKALRHEELLSQTKS